LAVDNADRRVVRPTAAPAFNYHAALSRYVLNWMDAACRLPLPLPLLLLLLPLVQRQGCAVPSVANWQTRRTHVHAHVTMTSHVTSDVTASPPCNVHRNVM